MEDVGGGGVAESKMETEEGQKKAQKNAKMRLYTVRKKDERNQEAGRKEGGREEKSGVIYASLGTRLYLSSPCELFYIADLIKSNKSRRVHARARTAAAAALTAGL